MSNLSQIANRHVRDHWRDALFIAAALLLMAISIGSVTSKAAKSEDKGWSLTVVESNLEITR